MFLAALAMPVSAAEEATVSPSQAACEPRPGYFCSLAAAIDHSNRNPGPDVLHLQPEAEYELFGVDHGNEGGNGLPAITGSLRIEGHGAVIERSRRPGTPELRLFRVAAEGDLTLRQVRLRNGATPKGFDGAAIWNVGSLTIERSVLEDNHSGDDGGAIRNDGVLRISDSLIRDNSARWRGGVGGGLQNAEQHGRARAHIERTTFVGNEAWAGGGGVWLEGTVLLENVTISGNRSGQRAGGIENYGELEMRNCTVVGNQAGVDGGGLHSFRPVTIGNSILTGNQAMISADCDGRLLSRGHNLIGGSYRCVVLGNENGNRLGIEPDLAPLESRNGAWVHVPLPGSVAIDGGNRAAPGSSEEACAPLDQLGRARGHPRADRCDIGAVETHPVSTGSASELEAASEQDSSSATDRHDEAIRKLRAWNAQVTVRRDPNDEGRLMVALDGAWEGGDEGLAVLKQVDGLFKLRLGGRLTDAGLRHVGALDGLTSLDVHVLGITDEGVFHLRNLEKLQRLNLTYTQVSDPGLRHLTRLQRLQWLGLAYTRVTSAGVEKLRQDLPDTIIEGNFRQP